MRRRRPCCSKQGLNKGAWTSLEDKILSTYINAHGEGRWATLAKRSGLKRCSKSCRLRWLNYLKPGIKRGNISPDEEELIVKLHNLLGNRWSLIAGRLPGRTDNEIKNYWNTMVRKRVTNQKNFTLKPEKRNPQNSIDSTQSTTDDHQVIRPKPTRCTKVVIPHYSPPPPPPQPATNTNSPGTGTGTSRADQKCTQDVRDYHILPFFYEHDFDSSLCSAGCNEYYYNNKDFYLLHDTSSRLSFGQTQDHHMLEDCVTDITGDLDLNADLADSISEEWP